MDDLFKIWDMNESFFTLDFSTGIMIAILVILLAILFTILRILVLYYIVYFLINQIKYWKLRWNVEKQYLILKINLGKFPINSYFIDTKILKSDLQENQILKVRFNSKLETGNYNWINNKEHVGIEAEFQVVSIDPIRTKLIKANIFPR